jgi:hypothetical protein
LSQGQNSEVIRLFGGRTVCQKCTRNFSTQEKDYREGLSMPQVLVDKARLRLRKYAERRQAQEQRYHIHAL